MPSGDLTAYRAKRNFSRTAEPAGKVKRSARTKAKPVGGVFVVHKHAARRLHYDLRLEHAGILWSWAVTRGPSLDPQEKRLAVHVEDHPLDYASFEGTIPAGEYGAGTVIVWDEGRWEPEGDPARGMAKGHLVFSLSGSKLGGRWHLVRLKPRRGERNENWLLIKSDDDAARDDGDILSDRPESVASGRTIEEVAADAGKPKPGRAATRRAGAAKPSAKAVPPPSAAKARTAASSRAKATMPDFVPPALATLEETPPAGEAWLHEVKFDGYRLQARVEHGPVRLLTRSGLDWTERFRALADAFAALPVETAIVDGEVVAMGEDGISSFSALQAALAEGRTGALIFYAFDLLYLDGDDLTRQPLIARKDRLEALLGQADGPLRFSEHFIEPGSVMLKHACRMGLEGVVSKRVDSPYRSGRGRDWIKSKCTMRQEFVIAGYVPSQAASRDLRSLVLGYHEGGELKPAGRVGTGFTRKSAALVKAALEPLRTDVSPFRGKAARERGIVWVKPERVAEIEFRAWTASRTLRHASYLGLREDKPADEVVAENAAPAEPEDKPKRRARSPRQASPPETSVKLSNADKVLWPDIGFTKGDLLRYYQAVWPRMAPFVTDRPLSLVRAPNGIKGHSFFQKHASPGMPDAIRTQPDKDGESLLFIRDFDGLAGLVQLGSVEIHVWGSTVAAIEQPDQLIFDLDPDAGVDAERVRRAALTVRDRLAELGFASWPKTSGGKGYHVVVPIKPKIEWPEAKAFCRDFAKALAQQDPGSFTATLSKQARRGRIFIDYLRNGRGATAIAAYSVRGRPGAPVAMPITWADVERGTAPDAVRGADIIRGGVPDTDAWSDFKASRSL